MAVDSEETHRRLDTLLEKSREFKDSDYESAMAIHDQVIDLALQINDRGTLAQGYEGKAQMLWKMADPVHAHTYYEKSLSIHTELGNHYGISVCFCGMGIIASNNEDFTEGLEYFERAIAASQQAEHDVFTHVLICNVGNVYLRLARYTDALACFKTAEDYYRGTEENEKLAHVFNGIAGVLVFQGDHSQGLVYLKKSMDLHLASNSTYGIATVMANIGHALQGQGKLKEAERQFLKTLDLTRKIKFRSQEYDVHKYLSALYSELEMPEKSAYHLNILMEGEQETKKEMLREKNERFRLFGNSAE